MATLSAQTKRLRARFSRRWGMTWPGLNQPHRDLRQQKWWVLGLVLAVMFIGWSAGTLRAAAVLSGDFARVTYGHDWATALSSTLQDLSLGVAVYLAAYLAIRYYLGTQPSAVGLSIPRTHRDWRRTLVAASAFLYLTGGSVALSTFLFPRLAPMRQDIINTYEGERTGWDLASDLAGCFQAGSEELAFVALPVLLLTAAGFRQAWIWVLAVLCRLSFHMYYFPDVAWVLIWATLTLVLFRLTRSILGMILAHIAWDVAVIFVRFPGLEALGGVLMLVFVISACVLLILEVRRRPKRTVTSTAS